jgi:hypothetical protein
LTLKSQFDFLSGLYLDCFNSERVNKNSKNLNKKQNTIIKRNLKSFETK